MDLSTLIPTILGSIILGAGGGYIAVVTNLETIETRQEEIIKNQDRESNNNREEIRELRQDVKEILRFLRDDK